MPDTENTPEPEETQEPQQETDLGDGGKKALDAEREARKNAEKQLREAKKSAADAMARVKEFEDKDRTESEKLSNRIKELESALAESTSALEVKDREVLRHDVAREKGVPVHLVTGTTKEEMEAAADAALEWRGTTKPAGFRSGASAPNGADKKQQAAAAIRQMRRN